MRRGISWFVLLTVSVLLSGCGSSGIESGMPADTDSTKVTDPMAGVKLKPIGKAAKKVGRNEHMERFDATECQIRVLLRAVSPQIEDEPDARGRANRSIGSLGPQS